MAVTIGLVFDSAEQTEEKELFVCPHCGKEYKSAAGLKAHMEKEHPQSIDTNPE